MNNRVIVEAGQGTCVGSWNGETNHQAGLRLALFGYFSSFPSFSSYLVFYIGACWGWIEGTGKPP